MRRDGSGPLTAAALPVRAARNRAALASGVAFVAVAALRYALLGSIHLWSLSRGRGGLTPIVLGGDDGDYYYRSALEIAAGWDSYLANIYPLLIGKLMAVTGLTDIFVYKLLNYGAGIGTVALAMWLYRRMSTETDDAQRTHAAPEVALVLLVGLYPSAVLFETMSLYRDGWIYVLHLACIAVIFRAATRGSRAWRLVAALGLLPLAWVLAKFRWYAAVALAIGVAGWMAQRWLRSRWRRSSTRWAVGATALAVIGIAVGVVVPRVAATIALNDAAIAEKLLSLLEYRSSYETSGAGSNLGIDLANASPLAMGPLLLYSVVSNAFGPLPWQVTGGATAAAFVSEVPVFAVLGFFVWRWRALADDAVRFLVWQAVAWFLLIGLFNDNLGTALRLRVLGWHCLMIAFAVLLRRRIALRTVG